jgi:Uma2 family endonuclease
MNGLFCRSTRARRRVPETGIEAGGPYHPGSASWYRSQPGAGSRWMSIGKSPDAGVFAPDDRVELIAGEIIEMPPVGSRHAVCVDRLDRLFSRLTGDDVVVRIPIFRSRYRTFGSCPEPPNGRWTSIRARRTSCFWSKSPTPRSSTIEAPSYLRTRRRRGQIEINRDPLPAGYQSRTVATAEDRLTPLALPSLTVSLRGITG